MGNETPLQALRRVCSQGEPIKAVETAEEARVYYCGIIERRDARIAELEAERIEILQERRDLRTRCIDIKRETGTRIAALERLLDDVPVMLGQCVKSLPPGAWDRYLAAREQARAAIGKAVGK